MKKMLGLAAMAALAASAMGAPPPQGPSQQDMQQFMNAMNQLGAAMAGAASNNTAQLVSHKDLKALLPAELPGLKRTSASAETQAAMGMRVAKAEASYEGENGASIDIEITDMGGMGGLAGLAAMGMNMADIDKETDDGFERTFAYKGNKAKEEYNTKDKNGSIELMTGGRFMVKIDGSDVKHEALRGALDKLDLAKLASLKPAPPAK